MMQADDGGHTHTDSSFAEARDARHAFPIHGSKTKENIMNKLTVLVGIVVTLSWGVGAVGAADPMGDKEAKPSMGERLTKDTVKGTLMRMDGEYYWVKDMAGKEIKLHVDASTKLDKVIVGDKVKAYVGDNGHTTTLQREE